jgi:hypothetical protein
MSELRRALKRKDWKDWQNSTAFTENVPKHLFQLTINGVFAGAGAGALVVIGESRIDFSLRPLSEKRLSPMQVRKKSAARIAVVRVSVSAAPRGENRPPRPDPPPPMPSAPPSDRCSRTNMMRATAMKTSARINRVCNSVGPRLVRRLK